MSKTPGMSALLVRVVRVGVKEERVPQFQVTTPKLLRQVDLKLDLTAEQAEASEQASPQRLNTITDFPHLSQHNINIVLDNKELID